MPSLPPVGSSAFLALIGCDTQAISAQGTAKDRRAHRGPAAYPPGSQGHLLFSPCPRCLTPCPPALLGYASRLLCGQATLTRRDTLLGVRPTRGWRGLRAHSARTFGPARACLPPPRSKSYRQCSLPDAGPPGGLPLGTGHHASHLISDKILPRALSLVGALGRHGWSPQGHARALALVDAFWAAIMAVAEYTRRAPLRGCLKSRP